MKITPPPASRLKQFGLKLADWWRLLVHQRESCDICGRRFTLRRVPCIDHDHRSGLVRGLLCHSCNDRLGFLHEDAAWLESAARYLNNPPASVLGIVAKHVAAPPFGMDPVRVAP